MRVSIDQSRQEPQSAHIDALACRPLERAKLITSPDRGDLLASHCHRAVCDVANTYVAIQRRKVGAEPNSIPSRRGHMQLQRNGVTERVRDRIEHALLH